MRAMTSLWSKHLRHGFDLAPRRFALLALLTIVLSGCASFSSDQGMGPVGSLAEAKLGKDVLKIRSP